MFNFAHLKFINMKHITFTLISIVMMACLMPSLHAQTAPVPSGPVVMNFSKEHYDHAVLANNDQQLVAYCSPIWQKLKKCYHSIVTYDKTTNITSSCVLNLSSDYKRLVAYDAGDSYFVTYSRYPKATEFELSTTFIPKDCANNYTVTPHTVLSLDIDRNGYVQSFVAESADHTKHAIVLVGRWPTNFTFMCMMRLGGRCFPKSSPPTSTGTVFPLRICLLPMMAMRCC